MQARTFGFDLFGQMGLADSLIDWVKTTCNCVLEIVKTYTPLNLTF